MTRITLSAYDKWINSDSDDEYVPNWYDKLTSIPWKIKCAIHEKYYLSVGWYFHMLRHKRLNDWDYLQFLDRYANTIFHDPKFSWHNALLGKELEDDMYLLRHEKWYDADKPMLTKAKCIMFLFWRYYTGKFYTMRYDWRYRWGDEDFG